MMNYVEQLGSLKEDINIFLISLLLIILVVSTIDFSFGWINARFNKNVIFKSSKALFGIIKKMMYFITLIIFAIVSLAIFPHEIALPAITILYGGYIFSELNSILSHLELTDDGKKGEMFRTFITNILNKKGDD